MRNFHIPTPAQRDMAMQRTYDMAFAKAEELGYGPSSAGSLSVTAAHFQQRTGCLPTRAVEVCVLPKDATLSEVDAAMRKAWDDAMGVRPA